MSRLAIAWLLIGLMLLALAAAVAWKVYHSRNRVLDRQRSRDKARGERRIDESRGH
jgi:hypothetical protein